MSLSSTIVDKDLTVLSRLLDPLPVRDFLEGYWAKRFVHVSGASDKFAGLFSWDELNHILERFPTEPPRLRLNKNGKEVDSSRYLTSVRLGERVGLCRLNADRLTSELKDGATLNFNCADEMCPALNELCEGLERVFRVAIGANVYAVLAQEEEGLPLHWDEQDNLIIQISGRKRWTIFEPTKIYPLANDPDLPPTPIKEPVWDGILCSGSLMHVPRGWWHLTHPINEPSLHVTITVKSLTGSDFLQWLVRRLMRTSKEIRKNLPLLNSNYDRIEYLQALRTEIVSEWEPDLLDRFISLQETRLRVRPRLELPAGPTLAGDSERP